MAIWDIKERYKKARANETRGSRALWFSGTNPDGNHNTIDYVTMAAPGNATDFGDLTVARSGGGDASNGHGGLS